jgi:hypothetical protein
MLTIEKANELATDWFEAWNSHDINRIMNHYSDDVQFTSPFVVKVMGVPSGTIRGKENLRDYFATALQKYPDLCFNNLKVTPGLGSMVLCYESINHLDAAETMILGDDNETICSVLCHYAPRP